MKTFTIAVSSVLLAACLLSGCAFMNEEDREFYGKGWIKPTDLDKQEPRHFYADPAQAPVTSKPPATRDSDPAWIVPETTDNPR